MDKLDETRKKIGIENCYKGFQYGIRKFFFIVEEKIMAGNTDCYNDVSSGITVSFIDRRDNLEKKYFLKVFKSRDKDLVLDPSAYVVDWINLLQNNQLHEE